MDSFVAPWPALVKRVRFLSSLKQADLAETLDVDQTSVSRWERGLTVPDFPVQKRLREMLRKLEPAIDRRFIEHVPGIVGIGRMESIGSSVAASVSCAAMFQLTPADMRDRWFYDVLGEDETALSLLESVDSTPGWRHGEIAMWSATMLQPDGTCFRFTGSPIGDTGLYMSIAGVVPPPKDFTQKDFELTLKPYDELCD